MRWHISSWIFTKLNVFLPYFFYRTIYSTTTILEKYRKVVLEKWFCKLGFLTLANHFSPTWKKLDLWYIFFSGQPLFSNQISRTRFLEPDFSNHISKNCKNWGRRIKGWVYWESEPKLSNKFLIDWWDQIGIFKKSPKNLHRYICKQKTKN